MNNYTVILHKPDSESYCRGCHMESYPGDFEVRSNISEEGAIELIAKSVSQKLDYSETGYTAYLLVPTLDGDKCENVVYEFNDNGSCSVTDSPGDIYYTDEFQSEFKRISKAIADKRTSYVNDHLVKEQEEQKKEKEAKEKAQKAYELKLLAELKNKHEKNNHE